MCLKDLVRYFWILLNRSFGIRQIRFGSVVHCFNHPTYPTLWGSEKYSKYLKDYKDSQKDIQLALVPWLEWEMDLPGNIHTEIWYSQVAEVQLVWVVSSF